MARRLAEVYTVQDTSDGSWATWNVTPGKGGTFVLSLLCQRENSQEESYKEIGRARFLSDDSVEMVMFYDHLPHRMAALAFLPAAITATGIRVRGHDGATVPEGYRALEATACKRCGRMLTRPVSIDAGMGEICSGHKPRAGSKYATAKGMTPETMHAAIMARRK